MKKPVIQIHEDNPANIEINHEQSSCGSNEAYNKKLFTSKERLIKQHPKKLLQNKSSENKGSIKKENSSTKLLSHLKEKEYGKGIETKLPSSTDPKTLVHISHKHAAQVVSGVSEGFQFPHHHAPLTDRLQLA